MLYSGRGETGLGDAQLAELEAIVEQPTATPADWLRYAQKLQSVGQYKPAVLAYQRFLRSEPAHRQASMQCAECMARLGDADAFHRYMADLLAVDPRLTQEIMNWSVVQQYLAEDRFQTLRREAAAQSMD